MYPENWDAVTLYLRVQTQWHVGSMGARTGLNYPGVLVVAGMIGQEMTKDLFAQLQIMEITALKELKSNG